MFILFALAFLVSTNAIYSDGIYLPERAFQKIPEIPTQRAIISYKEGIETLIIESSVSAEGQSFGWVLPLPVGPTEIGKAPKELLDLC